MAEYNYSEDELREYFSDPNRRHSHVRRARTPIGRFWQDRFGSSRKSRAFTLLSYIVLAGVLAVTFVGGYLLTLVDELPSMQSIENPDFQLATIAYTADGEELARFARQNRSWATYEEISPHVINALWATEDHRFYAHWGIDLFGTMTAVPLSILQGDPRGASSISQQLARNLYNEEIGRRVTIARKLKEMVTAVQLERRYTKSEIIEMYLNTVDFGSQTYGIEAAARKYFGKTPLELNELEGATLVGMLKATTTYNPLLHPENARQRRNVVMSQMIKHDVLSPAFYEEHKEDSVKTDYRSAAITESLAPHFAEEVRKQAQRWAEQNGLDIYEDGLVIYTTLDSRMQKMAMAVADSLMPCLERVAAHEWSRPVSIIDSTGTINHIGIASENPCDYMNYDFEPWSEFWRSQPSIINQTIRDTGRYRSLVRSGSSGSDAIESLRENQAFMDSLKAVKTRLELGFVAMDPGTGHVRTWIGGTDLESDWYDHVAIASRQPGSTFKPFVYTAAIDEGWSPYYTLMDDTLNWVDDLGNVWSPGNSAGFSGQMTTLRKGLAQSLNSITARLMIEVGPPHVAFYARRMGIESPLNEVPALALGTSDVTLLEMTTAYSTFANGGLLYEPVVITQIQDRSGNILYESESVPKEALSEATAYTMIDMMRAVVQPGLGTGQRIRTQYGLYGYDLAGKTGTTQYSADNWFMLMHPDLVVGSWVGFNDPRFRFRTDYWGQGAHTALHLVGQFMVNLTEAEDTYISQESRFPSPQVFGANYAREPNPIADSIRAGRRGGVAW